MRKYTVSKKHIAKMNIRLNNKNFNNNKKFSIDYKAVSEALGTIFLLAISMALVGLVYYWVSTMPDPVTRLEVDFKATVELDENNQHIVKVKHNGGEKIETNVLEILVKVDDITQGKYQIYRSGQSIFNDDIWEFGEVWVRNIDNLHDWNVSLPEIRIEVLDINADQLLMSVSATILGERGNLADLKVSEEDITFSYENSTLRRGEWVNITTRIHNIGGLNAFNVIVRFFDSSEVISHKLKDYRIINSIPFGTYSTIWVNWTPDYSGVRNINIKVYSTQLENDYGNNYATKKLEVEPILPKITGPNLEIENIIFNPETPTHGEWVTITVLVKNIGDEEIPSGTEINVTLWDENGYIVTKGTYLYNNRTMTTNITEFETIQPPFLYNAQTTYGGTTTIYAQVSTNITESKYDDNVFYRNIQILPTILLVDDDGIFERFTKDDVSSYMDASLQLAVGSGQFDVWTVKGTNGPKFSSGEKPLRNYDIVIWMTGYQTSNTLTISDQNAIKEYLDNNGKLWLIGMNILQEIGIGSFARNYVGVVNYNITGTPGFLYGVMGENLTQGMVLNTSNIIKSQDNGLNLTLRNSLAGNHTIDGILGNDAFLGTDGNMSLKYYNATEDFKVVYFSWEFASMFDMVNRNNLTIQILKWFGWELEVGTDLAISSKGFSNTAPNFMDWITITARVRNNGPRDLARVRVDFFIIDTNGVEKRIPEYPGFENVDNPMFIYIPGGGGEREVQKQWLAISVGRHTFRVVVDLEDEIEEVSEENNDDFYSPLFVTQLYIGYTILVVDDDNSTNNGGVQPNVTNDITTSLEELGYPYDTFVTQGGAFSGPGPNITVMKHYNSVIWCTGYDGVGTLLAKDREHLSYYFTRTNFSEANFLGDTKFNAWITGQEIIDDLEGPGMLIEPGPTSFLYRYLRVKQYSTLLSNLPNYMDGKFGDNITHGITYPMVQSPFDSADTIVPTEDAKGIFWQDNSHTKFNGLRYNSTYSNLVFTPWVFSLINDSTTTHLNDESYKSELCYLILRWFFYPDERIELKTSPIDISLSSHNPVLGSSYIIKSDVYNIGYNDTSAIVRFLDGDTIINTKSIFVPANGNTSTEVIWSPLFAGYRNIKISVDPDNDLDEVFDGLNNNASLENQLVYFFYDDLENGTGNWNHDSTIVLINGESPLEYMDNPVYSNVNSSWNWSDSEGFFANVSEYHSFDSSYYTIEPIGIGGKQALDIVLALDTSGSMSQEMNDLQAAARNFINHRLLDKNDRVAIYAFNNEAPIREQDFTECDASGKSSLITTINGLAANGYTPLWDTIGESINYLNTSGSTRLPIVIAMTDGEDYGSGWGTSGGNEDGSEDYCPWHDWDNGTVRFHNVDSTNGHDHHGWYNGWGWQNLDDTGTNEWRRGLLNSPVKIYTVGLGLVHHNNSGSSSSRFPDGWMGLYAHNTLGPNYRHHHFNESGTTEFNLWRVANTSNGEYFYATQASQLNTIFQSIAANIVETTTVERSTPNDVVAKPSGGVIRSSEPRGSRDQIFFDGFETGDFTGGPWTPQSNNWGVYGTYQYSGTYYAEGSGNLNDHTLTLNTDVDLRNYDDVKLSLYQYTFSVETSDFMRIDVSDNSGSTWTNIASWNGQQLETGDYRQYIFPLSTYDGEPNFRIRFRFTMSTTSEYWFIDEVLIYGNSTSQGGTKHVFNPTDRNLTTHTFSLSNVTSAKLSFYHKYSLRNGLNGVVVMVGVPDTTGTNWLYEYARPTQPYTGNYWIGRLKYDDFNNDMRWCWNGISGGGKYTWEYIEVDLTNWTGLDKVRVRLHFMWAGAGDGGGYFVDDLKIIVTRNESQALTTRTIDQWEFTSSDSHSGDYCWWNRNISTGHLSGGLDNSLYTRPIDLTNARNATLSGYFKFNINTASGRPPDGFRVEISSDNGVTWKAINMGVRTSWGVSTNGTDNDDGVIDGKSYSGLDVHGQDTSVDGWIEANTLTRLNTDISGWAGSVIILRFRILTASDNNPYFGAKHYQWKSPSNNAYGVMIDDIIIYGFSLLN